MRKEQITDEIVSVVHLINEVYEKFGFRVVAEKPNAFKLKDGTYRSEFYMQKYLREI